MPNYSPYQYQQYAAYQQPYPSYQMQPQQLQGTQQMYQAQPTIASGQSQQMQGVQQSQQIQSGGFISVRSIEEAFNYPVAPGNSVMFKDENAPYVYTKTKGFSQLEEPVFEKYRLVKEENGQTHEQAQNNDRQEEYALRSDFLDAISDFDDLRKEIKRLRGAVDDMQNRLKKERRTMSKTETTGKEKTLTENESEE